MVDAVSFALFVICTSVVIVVMSMNPAGAAGALLSVAALGLAYVIAGQVLRVVGALWRWLVGLGVVKAPLVMIAAYALYLWL